MRVPKLIIPALIVIFIVGGILIQPLFYFPTTEVAFAAQGDSTVEFVVDGLKCRGTAGFFTNLFSDVDGIESITTYATTNSAIFIYDSKKIDADRIAMLFQREFKLQDGSFHKFFSEVSRKEY